MAGGVTTRTSRSAVARRAQNLRRACRTLAPALLLCLGVTEVACAQDIEPRRWTHLPDGTSTLAIGYAGRDADIYFNPLIGITDGTAELNAWVARFTHAFGWGGNTARFDVIVPYVSGTWQGLVDGVPGRRSITAGEGRKEGRKEGRN